MSVQQQQSSHLVLQIILPVHLVVGDVKVIVGVVVVKHAAGGKPDGESVLFTSNSIDFSCFSPEKEAGQDLQLVDPIRSHEVREWGRGWRWWRYHWLCDALQTAGS